MLSMLTVPGVRPGSMLGDNRRSLFEDCVAPRLHHLCLTTVEQQMALSEPKV